MDSGFSMRPIYLSGMLAILVILFFLFKSSFDSQTTVVFCDVGQGDGAYIRIRNQVDILVDAGPDRKILDCLGRYMPFYDRTIELAFISHPQKDHYGGYVYILERYNIQTILMSPLDSTAITFKKLKDLLAEKHVRMKSFYAGQKINVSTASIKSLWPSEKFVGQNIRLSPKDDGFYSIRRDPNDFSQVFLFSEGKMSILFTGDIDTSLIQGDNSIWPKVEILKVPHHGSKNGMDEVFLQTVKPPTVVISNAKNNSYGHPSAQIINLLEKYRVRIRRTDTEGDIVFKF